MTDDLASDLDAALRAVEADLATARTIIDDLAHVSVVHASAVDALRDRARAWLVSHASPPTATDWEAEGRRAAVEGLTPDEAAARFGEIVASSPTATDIPAEPTEEQIEYIKSGWHDPEDL